MKEPTLQTIDTKLDMYMASNDKLLNQMGEAIIAVSNSQADSKTMQVEINALSGRIGSHAQDIKDIRKESLEMRLAINNNTNAAEHLKDIRKDQKAMGHKLLGSVIFACLCMVASLFVK